MPIKINRSPLSFSKPAGLTVDFETKQRCNRAEHFLAGDLHVLGSPGENRELEEASPLAGLLTVKLWPERVETHCPLI
jgi:hypothetical protein